MPVSTQVQAIRRFREKETEVKSTIDSSIIGGITFNTLASLDLTQLEILKGQIITVITLQKRRVKIGSDVAYIPCSNSAGVELEVTKAVERVESIEQVKQVEHVPNILETPKIELKEADSSIFHKSIDELVDIAATKESEFKATYAYEVADKIRAKAKKAAFTAEANEAHKYLSAFMNALLMAKFNELGSDDKYRHVKMAWLDANQSREDYLTDVTMFKKVAKSEQEEKKSKPRPKKKKDDSQPIESKIPQEIADIYPFLQQTESMFKHRFETQLSEEGKAMALAEIERIVGDIKTIQSTFDSKWKDDDDTHSNLRIRIGGFSEMLMHHINTL